MTTTDEILYALSAPFDPGHIRERQGGRGEVLRYITAQCAMNRLDEVLGAAWSDATGPVPDGSGNYVCRLTITFPDGTRATRTGIGAPGAGGTSNPGKAAASDAFKRAAVKFGVARYLAKDGPARLAGDAREPAQPPPRRDPTPEPQPHRKERDQWGPGHGPPPRQEAARTHDGPPRSGKALWARLKDLEKEHGEGLIRYAGDWARLQEIRGRMVEWSAGDVELVYGEVTRKIREHARSDEATEALAN